MLRWVWVAVVGIACGGETPPETSDDALVLELGGQAEPLRESLRRVGRAGVMTREEATVEVQLELPKARVPDPRLPKFFTVYLREGETLYRLAATHLGSGSRWRELLALNGWTEAQATRLKVGAPVKLPIRQP